MQIAAANFARAQQIVTDAPNKYWQRVADKIDVYSRQIMPATYACLLGIFYNIALYDGYDLVEGAPMWRGLSYPIVHVHGYQWVRMLMLPFVIGAMAMVWAYMKTKAKIVYYKHKMAREQNQKEELHTIQQAQAQL